MCIIVHLQGLNSGRSQNYIKGASLLLLHIFFLVIKSEGTPQQADLGYFPVGWEWKAVFETGEVAISCV